MAITGVVPPTGLPEFSDKCMSCGKVMEKGETLYWLTGFSRPRWSGCKECFDKLEAK